jgi:hypothetical protein
MWRNNVEAEYRQFYVKRAGDLMRDTARFRAAMLEAARTWRYSCEHNLTARSMNRRAWLGHAGSCVAVDSPEDLTRLAWHTLTTEQQILADAAADDVIAIWEESYVANLHLSKARVSKTNQAAHEVLQEA